MSIAAEDWDDLSVARRRRGQRAATETPAADAVDTVAPTERVAMNAVAQAVITRGDEDEDDEFVYAEPENLRPAFSIAGGNLAIWALGHLTGVVELIGVSFLASVGLLLASYVLREWRRDRAALVCLAGALPLPVTIFSLLT
jgi:hypothetical protein